MAISYTSVELKNPTKPEEPSKFYAKSVMSKRTELEDIAKSISKQSTTVSHIDVHAVLLALTDEISDRLINGENIHLGNLGYFHTTIKSKGVSSKEKVNSSIIEEAKVRFVSGKALEEKLKVAEFTIVKK